MKWYVLYTRPHHERAVSERLFGKGFQVYLPLSKLWRKSKTRLHQVTMPLFPRVVFVHCYLAWPTLLELINIPGVIRLQEDGHGGFLTVPEEELRLLQRLNDCSRSLECTSYPAEGIRVQVSHGQLQGISGVIRKRGGMTLQIPFHSLRAAVTMDMSGMQVRPCTDDAGSTPAALDLFTQKTKRKALKTRGGS